MGEYNIIRELLYAWIGTWHHLIRQSKRSSLHAYTHTHKMSTHKHAPRARALLNPLRLTIAPASISNSCCEAMMSCGTIRHVSAYNGGSVRTPCCHGQLSDSHPFLLKLLCCLFGGLCWRTRLSQWPLKKEEACAFSGLQTHNNATHKGGSRSWEGGLQTSSVSLSLLLGSGKSFLGFSVWRVRMMNRQLWSVLNQCYIVILLNPLRLLPPVFWCLFLEL